MLESIFKVAVKSELELLIDKLKTSSDAKAEQAITYIKNIKDNPNLNPFVFEDILSVVIENIFTYNTDKSFDDILKEIQEIYDIFLPEDIKTDNYEKQLNLFLKIIKPRGLFEQGLFKVELSKVFTDFESLQIILQAMNNKLKNRTDKIEAFCNYTLENRQYFADEIDFISHLFKVLNQLEIEEDFKLLLFNENKENKKRIGLYDIDKDTLEEIDDKVNSADGLLQKLDKLTAKAKSLIELLTSEKENFKDDIISLKKEQLQLLKDEIEVMELEIKNSINRLFTNNKNDLQTELDKIVRQTNNRIDEKLKVYGVISEQLNKDTNAEISRIQLVGKEITDNLNNLIQNSDFLNGKTIDTKVLESIKDVNSLFNQISKDELKSILQLAKQPTIIEKNCINVEQSKIVVPSFIWQDTESRLSPVNYFFDETIPFSNRYQKIKNKMAMLEDSKKIVYHPEADTIIRLLLENCIPYLYGPSGSGKNYLIKMISEVLGIEYIKCGRINEEYDIIGYNRASDGVYQPTLFYNGYKYGKMIFYDELDSGFSNAAVKLNSVLSEDSFTFTNNEMVNRHPNFRIIGAGNTADGESNPLYTARNKLDESVIQRMIPIYISYDANIEKHLLEDYPDWYEFISNYRKCLKEYARSENLTYAPGDITTRDINNIRKFKEHKSFNDTEILKHEVVQSKNDDYLNQILKELENMYSSPKQDGYNLYKSFKKLVKEKEKNG